MKSVLISIQPKWCKLIANGKKTVEVRKTRPKIETPFKCYIYCTHNNRKNAWHIYINSGYGRKNFGAIGNWRSGKDVVDVNSHLPAYRYNAYLAEGKVIGEFVCDEVGEINKCVKALSNSLYGFETGSLEESCLTEKEIDNYLNGEKGYGWHISDLKIYDKPKELCEFKKFCNHYFEGDHCEECNYFIDGRGYEYDESDCGCNGLKPIERPPQSWSYVEELEVEK